jgi:HAE1 family hydrophobic/amphiphilic exporter-1
VPSGFVPEEDQGYVMVLIQAPPGASLDYTMNIVRQTEQIDDGARPDQDDVRGGRLRLHGHVAEPGHRLRAAEGFQGRRGEAIRRRRIVGQLFGGFSQITGALVIPFLPPSIQGLGQFGGFTYELLDQSGGRLRTSRRRRSR